MSEISFPTPQWKQWAKQLSSIRDIIMDLSTKRQIHKRHFESLALHQSSDGTAIVHDWMLDNYRDSMLLGLRRLVDTNRNVFSLTNLLKTLAKNSDLLSRERFMTLWSADPEAGNHLAPHIIYRRFSSDGRTFDRTKVETDLQNLKEKHDAILKYINSSIAHCGSDPNTTVIRHDVDWDDLDSLYLAIAAIFNDYNSLLNRGVHVDFTAVLPAGFEEAFRRMIG